MEYLLLHRTDNDGHSPSTTKKRSGDFLDSTSRISRKLSSSASSLTKLLSSLHLLLKDYIKNDSTNAESEFIISSDDSASPDTILQGKNEITSRRSKKATKSSKGTGSRK